MGVFVVDGGDNWKTSLTTGKKGFLDVLLATLSAHQLKLQTCGCEMDDCGFRRLL